MTTTAQRLPAQTLPSVGASPLTRQLLAGERRTSVPLPDDRPFANVITVARALVMLPRAIVTMLWLLLRTRWRRLVKESVERALALVVLVAALPVLLVIALVVKLTSPGPVFFRQHRVSRHGETFEILKFRTMQAGAESLLETLRDRNDADGLLFKMRDDPRVTRVGRLLRRWSLDELPQLVNVLRGDMALVGPRPPLPGEVARYSDGVRRRLLVKPGLTGLWQVSGRSDLSWEESVRLDLYYVENWSLALDARILVRTLRAVASSAGAY